MTARANARGADGGTSARICARPVPPRTPDVPARPKALQRCGVSLTLAELRPRRHVRLPSLETKKDEPHVHVYVAVFGLSPEVDASRHDLYTLTTFGMSVVGEAKCRGPHGENCGLWKRGEREIESCFPALSRIFAVCVRERGQSQVERSPNGFFEKSRARERERGALSCVVEYLLVGAAPPHISPTNYAARSTLARPRAAPTRPQRWAAAPPSSAPETR